MKPEVERLQRLIGRETKDLGSYLTYITSGDLALSTRCDALRSRQPRLAIRSLRGEEGKGVEPQISHYGKLSEGGESLRYRISGNPALEAT